MFFFTAPVCCVALQPPTSSGTAWSGSLRLESRRGTCSWTWFLLIFYLVTCNKKYLVSSLSSYTFSVSHEHVCPINIFVKVFPQHLRDVSLYVSACKTTSWVYHNFLVIFEIFFSQVQLFPSQFFMPYFGFAQLYESLECSHSNISMISRWKKVTNGKCVLFTSKNLHFIHQ